MSKMSIPKNAGKQLDSLEAGIFDEDDSDASLGRLFAGCIAFLDYSTDEKNAHISSDSHYRFVSIITESNLLVI